MPGLKERAKTLVELLDGAAFLFATRPLKMDAKAEEILARAGRLHLKNLLPRLSALTDWTAASAEAAVRAYAEEEGAKLGIVAQPLRAALTGRSTSPGIFDVLDGARPRGEPRADRGSGRRISDTFGRTTTPDHVGRRVASQDLVVCPCSLARLASSSTSPQSQGH